MRIVRFVAAQPDDRQVGRALPGSSVPISIESQSASAGDRAQFKDR